MQELIATHESTIRLAVFAGLFALSPSLLTSAGVRGVEAQNNNHNNAVEVAERGCAWGSY